MVKADRSGSAVALAGARRWLGLAWSLACAAAAPLIYEASAPLAAPMAREWLAVGSLARVWLAVGPLFLLVSARPEAWRRRFAFGVAVIGAIVVAASGTEPNALVIFVYASVVAIAVGNVHVDRRFVLNLLRRMTLFASLTFIVAALAMILDGDNIELLRVWPAAIPLWVLVATGTSWMGRLISGVGGIIPPVVIELTNVQLAFSTSLTASLVYGCVLGLAAGYVGIAERLVAPTGALAVALFAAGITFYQRQPWPTPSPTELQWSTVARLLGLPDSLTELPAIAAYIEDTGPNTPLPNRVDELRIDVLDGRCDRLDTHLTFSWGPPRLSPVPPPSPGDPDVGKLFPVRRRRVAVVTNRPGPTTPARPDIPSDVDAYVSGQDPHAWEAIPEEVASKRWGLVREVAPEDGRSSTIRLPRVDWTAPAGIGTCYVLLPTVIGPDAMAAWKVGYDLIGNLGPLYSSDLPKAGPATFAHVTVNAERGELSVVRGPGTEADARNQVTWACDPRKSWQYQGPEAQGCVHGVVLVTKPWRRNFEQVMLLVIGAMFSVVVELSIRLIHEWN